MLMLYVQNWRPDYIFNSPKAFWTLTKDLLCFYRSVIRSVVEYGCVVWHHNLTTAQRDRLEAIQFCPRSL